MNQNQNLNALLNAGIGPPMNSGQERLGIPGFGPTSNNQVQGQGQVGMHGQQHGGPGQSQSQGDPSSQGPGNQGPPPPGPVMPNTAQLCRLGQETVQEIVQKTQDIFNILKQVQPPNGTSQSVSMQNERKAKLEEGLKLIGIWFKRLRKIFEKCNEATTEMEFVTMESLVPFKNEPSKQIQVGHKEDKKAIEQNRARLDDERKQYTEQLKLRNRQLKEIIDRLREIVWEINTMLAMRKA